MFCPRLRDRIPTRDATNARYALIARIEREGRRLRKKLSIMKMHAYLLGIAAGTSMCALAALQTPSKQPEVICSGVVSKIITGTAFEKSGMLVVEFVNEDVCLVDVKGSSPEVGKLCTVYRSADGRAFAK